MSVESTLAAAAVAGAGPIPPAAPAAVGALAPAVPPPAAAAAAAVIPVAGPPPAAAASITLTPEQWAAYTTTQTRLAELETAERGRTAAAAEAEVRALQARGQIEQAFAVQRQQAQTELEAERTRFRDTDARARRYALDGELARGLSAHPLVPGGAEQLTQLWRSQFVVEPQGDSFAVRTPTFQPVADFIAAQLALPQYAHFVRAQNPAGGTAGGTGNQSPHTAPGQTPEAAQPRNLGEQLAQQMLARGAAATDPRIAGAAAVNPDGSFGPQSAGSFGLRPLARQA